MLFTRVPMAGPVAGTAVVVDRSECVGPVCEKVSNEITGGSFSSASSTGQKTDLEKLNSSSQ